MPVRLDISPTLTTAIVATGIRTERVEQYPLAGIKGHLQVRHAQTEGEDNLNKAKVAEYRNKFKAGSTCPPIAVTKDGILIWGNHRVGGALAAEWADLPAIVFNVDGADPDAHTEAVLKTLSGRENAEHGLPLSTRDREMIVRKEIELGTSSGVIQTAYGMTGSQVSSLKREIDAETRLGDLGLWSLVKGHDRAFIRAFSGPAARTLTNEPFKALVNLAADAALGAKDINALAGAARDTGTEDGALEVIEARRNELANEIASIAVTGAAERPSPLTRLRKAVNECAGLCEKAQPSAYRDYTVDAATTKAQIEKAVGCLQAILAVQD